LTPTEIATGLLLEARALVAQQDGLSVWPIVVLASPNDALVRAWQTHPLQNVAARDGFAIARRALKLATNSLTEEAVDASVVLEVLDAAVAVLNSLGD
jgi:hypothetical protein